MKKSAINSSVKVCVSIIEILLRFNYYWETNFR